MSVGQPVRPIDWDARSTGLVPFTADLPGEHLHGAIVRSPHAFAEIVEIDTSMAAEMPGVHAVITAADFAAGVRYLHRGGPFADRPPLADGVVRHVGQEIAAVAAATPAQAEEACRAVRVRYRRRRAPLTVATARSPGAQRLHPRGTGEPNVSMLLPLDWGDADAGISAANTVVRGRFVYPSVAHACMEPSITLACWHPDREIMELWTSTQAPWFIAKEVSHLLGLRHEQVVCREVAVGGGFGQKSKAAEHEVLAAALARAADRPVLVELSREEEFAANKPRHRFETELCTWADADGVIWALEANVTVDNGSYNHMGSSVMRVGVITLGSMYRPDGVRCTARLVDTATQPGGQFRGYGTPQVSLAMESQVDEIAERLAIDPIELRLRNLAPEHSATLCGYHVTTSRLGDCLVAVRDQLGWDRTRRERARTGAASGVARGWGVAAGSHGSGAYAYEFANRSDAGVDLLTDGTARVRHGSADAGTGQNTILAQIASHELGVPIGDVTVVSMDGQSTPFELGAWSSRGTHMTGSSVGKAAGELADRLRALAAAKLGVEPAEVQLRDGQAVADDVAVDLGDLVDLAPEARDGELCHEASYLLEGTEMLASDRSTANLSPSYAFAAHGAVVDVDRSTGKVSVVDYVAAHDVGRAINPTAVEGQVVGGAAMGIGAALGEQLVREGGRVVNSTYLHYALPRNADLPSIRPVILDSHDDAGPYGAKSVGEMSIIPPGAAISNAVYDAIGVRIRELPITPDKVLTALAREQGRQRRHHLWRRPSRWWIALVRWAYPRGLHRMLDAFATRHAQATQPTSRTEPVVQAPDELPDAMAMLDGQAEVLGGATDAPVERARRSNAAPMLVAVGAMRELRGIERTRSELRIGAAVTLAELIDCSEIPPALAEAATTIASPQLRAAATVAGNLLQAKRCWFFRNGFNCYKRGGPTSPCYAVLGDHRFQHAAMGAHRCQAVTPSDLATVLLALDATVEITGPGESRSVPVGELYTGPGETQVRDDELVTAVRIPAESLGRPTAFTKLALYTGDFATASAAISLRHDEEGRWQEVRLVLGALAPIPWRATATEAALTGGFPDPAAVRRALDAELDRVADPLPGNAWKLDAAAGLAERAAQQLLTQLRPTALTIH